MLKQLLLLGIIIIIVDSGFIYLISNNFQKMIKKIQGSPLSIKVFPTIASYLILISSLYYFVIFKKGSLLDAFLLGFFIYGVYETTNMATFKDWNVYVGLIDLTWGGLLFLITTYLYQKSIKYII